MTSSNTTSSIEDKLHMVTRMPHPRPEFLADLRSRLTAELPRPISFGERLQLTFQKPAWVLTVFVLVLFAAFYAVGPQRVLAALQGMLGYVPGVGFLSTDGAFALREPVEITQNGRTVRVEQLLGSSKETVLVLILEGFPVFQNVGLENGIWLQIEGGYALLPGERGVEPSEIPGRYTGIFKFRPLPEETRQVVIFWEPSSGAEKWQIPVTLFPTTDAQVAKLLPQSYKPANAFASQQGITLLIDRVSSSQAGTAIRLQMTFPEVFNFVMPDTATIFDDLGNQYPSQVGQIHFEDQGQPYNIVRTPVPTMRVMENLQWTLNFPPVNQSAKVLALHLDRLSFRATPNTAITIDLGNDPAIGDSWVVDQTIIVGDLPFHVSQARLIELESNAPGSQDQSMAGLVLDIEALDPNQVRLDQIWLRVNGTQAVFDDATSTWAAAWSSTQIPEGTVDIYLERIQGILVDKWEIQWEVQQ